MIKHNLNSTGRPWDAAQVLHERQEDNILLFLQHLPKLSELLWFAFYTLLQARNRLNRLNGYRIYFPAKYYLA